MDQPILRLKVSPPTMINLSMGHECRVLTRSSLAPEAKTAVCCLDPMDSPDTYIKVNVKYNGSLFGNHNIMVWQIQEPIQKSDNNNQKSAI